MKATLQVRSLQGTHNAARRVLDSVTSLSGSVSEVTLNDRNLYLYQYLCLYSYSYLSYLRGIFQASLKSYYHFLTACALWSWSWNQPAIYDSHSVLRCASESLLHIGIKCLSSSRVSSFEFPLQGYLYLVIVLYLYLFPGVKCPCCQPCPMGSRSGTANGWDKIQNEKRALLWQYWTIEQSLVNQAGTISLAVDHPLELSYLCLYQTQKKKMQLHFQ